MKCSEYEILFLRGQEEPLGADEVAALAEHRARCIECAEFGKRVSILERALRKLPPVRPGPAADLPTRLLRRALRAKRLRLLGAAAAAVLVGFSAILLSGILQPEVRVQPTSTVTRPEPEPEAKPVPRDAVRIEKPVFDPVQRLGACYASMAAAGSAEERLMTTERAMNSLLECYLYSAKAGERGASEYAEAFRVIVLEGLLPLTERAYREGLLEAVEFSRGNLEQAVVRLKSGEGKEAGKLIALCEKAIDRVGRIGSGK